MGVKRSGPVYGAVDVGAGSGAKIGLFGEEADPLAEGVLPVGEYGGTPESLADGIARTLAELIVDLGLPRSSLSTIGLACPGLFRSDGSAIVVANMRFLWDANLPEFLAERLGVPVRIANDADAGALAEWSGARTELLYWVLGGGWGGAWVSAGGEILFPSLDWDRDDARLHYTNEPGYAIPLEKAVLGEVFESEGASFPHLEELCVDELAPEAGTLTGPSGNPDCVRAELLVSGPGRWRIFRTLAQTDITSTENLSPQEASKLGDSATAGEVISTLDKLGVEIAVRTDRLFGLVLAEAADVLFRQAAKDGCPPGIPVYVAGGPGRALELYGPAAREAMLERGITSELCPSRLEREGKNANLLGAAVLAGSGRKVS